MARRDMPIGGAIPLEAGERDRYVTVQQLTESVGSSRFPVETWSTLCTVWMHKLDLSARERFRLNQNSAASDVQFEMPYRADMDPELVDVPKKRRLLYLGRVFDITEASTIGRKEGIELTTLSRPDVAA